MNEEELLRGIAVELRDCGLEARVVCPVRACHLVVHRRGLRGVPVKTVDDVSSIVVALYNRHPQTYAEKRVYSLLLKAQTLHDRMTTS